MRRISGYISAHRPSAEKSVGHVDFFPRNGFALFDRFDHLVKASVFIDLVVILPVVERAVVVFDERFAEVVFVGMNREACAGAGSDVANDDRLSHCDSTDLRMRKAEYCVPDETDKPSLMR